MSKLRSLIVWSVVFTQLWTPVLAQTLPISVDKSVAGPKPSVGVSNGVPVVNIAPPSAGGVSNNRYTQFNVGPSGVVLNNSGGASQTQLAGQVGGNVMLGNRRATTILNQVTAPNPSQLMGTLEVAGNRANVIVANPAGITCNGCGFLNADRATLTTGRPQVGPDGGISLDVAAGKIRVEGEGLNGANLSQVDLIARSLEINAGVWADRLNVTAGAARVDYATGAVSAQAGEGAAPAVALDTAALGGMYANSIRLIGTEAGVGVNVGGNLVALTGDLQVSAAGDVRIAPSATMQAGRDLRVAAGGDLAVDGAAQAAGAVALAAGRNADIKGAVGAGGPLDVDAAGDVTVAAQAGLQAQGALRIAAGQDLSLGGSLLMGGQDLRAESGRNMRIGGAAPAPGVTPPATGGAGGGSGEGGGSGTAEGGGGNAGGGGAGAPGEASDAPAGAAQAGSGSGGLVTARGAVALKAGRDMALPGQVTAARDLSLQAAGNITLEGQTLASGNLSMLAGVGLTTSSASRLRADGSVTALAATASLGGLLTAGQSAQVDTRGDLRVDGTVLADAGTLKAGSGGNLTLGSASVLQAGRQLDAQAGGKLLADGTISSEKDILLSAGTDAELNGKTVANGRLSAQAGADLSIGQDGLAQGSGALLLDAGRDLRIAGTAGTADTAQAAGGLLQAQAARDLFVTGIVTAGSPASLAAARNLSIDGTAAALAGGLKADAGEQLRVGASGRMQASENLSAKAGTDLESDGVIVAGGDLALSAQGDARLGGMAAALGETAAGNLLASSGRDLIFKQGGQAQAAGTLTAQALRDLNVAGALTSVQDLMLAAARGARVDGTAASDANLTLAGRDITVGAAGLAQAGGTLAATAQGALTAAGRMLAGVSQTLTAGDGITVDGTVAALQGDLTLDAQRGDLTLGAASIQQAGASLAATAGGALQALGSAAAGQGMTLRAGTDATLGGVAATQAGDLTVNAAGTLTATADSQIQSAAALDFQAGGALRNAGILSAAGAASLLAGTALDNTGSVLAGGDVNATASGLLSNAGRFIAGVGEDGKLSLPGSLTLTAGFITHPGISAAGKDLSFTAGAMDLAGGNLSAIGQLALMSTGDIGTGNAVVHGGSLDIAAANLRNQGGKLTSAGDAVFKLDGGLDNASGLVAAAGSLRIEAAQVGNRAGTLAGGDLAIAATGGIDNRDGLIQADDTLTLNAASLDNSATLAAPAKGVLGKLVAIVADGVNNQAGSISASQDLTLTTRQLDNTGGEVAAQNVAAIQADTLQNSQGKLLAGKRLAVMIQALQGLGTLQSGEDLSFTYAGSLNQTGDIAAGRDLTMSVGGDMDNSARISAGRDLSVTAASLNNQASGELLAGRNNTINVTHGLTNAGLIDGASTRITAGRIDNFGRIYGDAISIRTGELVNGMGAGGGAVIASRGDLDLGVGSLVNRDHALIYAGVDLRIGGALDANGKAVGQAGSLLNASATIEAAGNAAIAAATILNQNNSYPSEVVQVESRPKVYFTPEGSTDVYDADTNWLCDTTTSMCSKDPAWLGDDPGRRFLLPSSQYPASRYGPPFDYIPASKGKEGVSSPIPLAYAPSTEGCSGGDAADYCWTTPEKFIHSFDSPVWTVFGVTPPAGPMPEWKAGPGCKLGDQQCVAAEAARRQAYEDDYAAYKAQYLELDARIREFNADFASRLVLKFTYYEVNETVWETRTVSSDPGKILSGGSMTLTGSTTNDKSQIAAGGALVVSGPDINNIGAGGVRSITREGTATVTQRRREYHREYYTEAYSRTLAAEPIELPVGTSGGYVPVSLTGGAPGASGASAPGPVQIASVGLPGGTVVRSVSNPAAIPDSQLFSVNGRPDAPYIVATDPRFVGQRPTVSSDYLFDLLRPPSAPLGNGGPGGWGSLIPAGARFLTPSGQPRRLGDGFYEQKLVSDQILATTGQRFLESFGDNDSQYKALLAAGAQFAQDNGIKLGVALTEAQQRQLTTDLVWLVEQTVTLPDGSTETVLVPQVYLLVRDGDLKGDGTLMAGRDVKLAADGDIVNSGTIGSRDATVMTASNIVNQAGGLIQGAIVDLAANVDLTNLASLIKGDYVSLSAGRDIALTSTEATDDNGSTWGTYISGVSRVDAGSLSMQAGRDLTLTAAQVAAKDDARLQAGRDINLGTLTESHGESLVKNSKNRHDLSTSSEIGSTIAAEGNLTLIAGQDVNARAADVTAGQQLAVGAGRDINVVAGMETGSAYDEAYNKTSGFMSSKSTHTIKSSDWEQSKASTFTGDTVVMMAGRDLTVAGSNVGAQRDMVLSAERDVNIVAGQNAEDSYDYKMVKKSGFGAMGGLSYGSSKQTDSLDSKKVFHNASTVGSVEGDVLVNAGNGLNITGSNVIARQGDITLIGKEVNIGAALDTSREKEFHEIKQTGLTLTASNPMVSAVQTGVRMADAAGKSDNAVMKGLAGATTGLAAVNAYDAVQASAKAAAAAELANPGSSNQIDKVGGVSIKLSLGTSKSSSTTDRNASNAFGSTVVAGKDLTIVAQGAGKDSDITVTGSNLSAGNNVVLKAEGDILLQAARNAFEQKTDSKSSSASIGIGYSTGGQQNGFTLELGASVGRGSADGRDESWTNSQITAGNVLAIQSGGDTTLKGAAGRAEQIIASVGGNLLLESLQDSSKYDSKNKSAGFGVSLCIPPYCVGSSSFSANASTGKMNSDFKSVTEQTGLWAGDGGFLIDVKNNTTLIGSVIASSDRAVADGLNKLTTGTLVTEDIKNTARYSGSQVSIGGGFGFGGDAKAGDSGLGTTKDGQVAGGATKEHGSSISTGSGGFGMGVPVVVAASGNSNSTTQSGISGGTIVIRDEAGQLALTGKTAAETIASLNRDTSDTLNALKPIFDKEKIEAGFEIASEATRQMGQFLTNRAKEIDALKTRAKDRTLPQAERDQAAVAAEKLASEWGPSGSYRRVVAAISAGAAGNVTGSTGSFVQAAAVNYLQGLGASQVKKIADYMGEGADSETTRALLHGIVGCAGAAATSGNCSAGALGAAASSVLAKLLAVAAGDDLSAEEREARGNLIASMVASISEATSADTTTSTLAAVTELTNNALTLSDLKRFAAEASTCEAFGNCDQVKEKFRKLSIETQEVMIAVCAADSEVCRTRYGSFVEQVAEYRQELDRLMGMDIPSSLKNDLAVYLLHNSDATSMVLNTEIAVDLQARWGINPNTAAQLVAIGASGVGWIKGVKGALPASQTAAGFEKSLVGLSVGEKVAQIKIAANLVAKANGMIKDNRVSMINGRDVYKAGDGNFYALDTQHGRFEVIDSKRGVHLGEVDFDFNLTKPADKTGGHNLKVR